MKPKIEEPKNAGSYDDFGYGINSATADEFAKSSGKIDFPLTNDEIFHMDFMHNDKA